MIAVNEQVSEDTLTVKRNTLSVKSSKTTLYPGVLYNLDLTMETSGVVHGLEAQIKYDERMIEVVSATSNVAGLIVDTSVPGSIRIAATSYIMNPNTILSNITIRIKEGFSGTAFIIPDANGTWRDASGNYSFTSLAGKLLSISEPDMNQNGIVEVGDLTLTAREDGMSLGTPGYDERYDITGDDHIDNGDLDYIRDRIFADDAMVLSKLPSVKVSNKSIHSAYNTSSAIVTRTTSYEYDKSGNLIKETDCNGRSIQYDYDAYNRVIRVTDKEDGITRIFYDEVDNVIKVVQPESYSQTLDGGPGETYTYDAMNRLREVRDASGTLVQKNIYDKDNLLTAVYDASGKAIEYAYDIGGRNISITTPKAKEGGKVSARYTYDALGYVTSITDGAGSTTLYERDMWGRALKVTDPYGVNTEYTYDKMGNLTHVTDGNGNPTTYVYNTLNNLSAIIDAQGGTIQYKYDKEGRLRKETDRKGNIIHYTYNSDGNLTRREGQGSNEYEEFLYHKDGSLLAAINNSSVESYTYTPNGYVKSKIRNGKTILDYQIDKNGRITRVTDANGDYTGYTYDEVGRLKTVTDGSTLAATYNYNPDNTIANIIYGAGIKAVYGYDSDKNITSLINKKADGSNIENFSYTYDYNGNQLTKTENGITTSYAYDKLNRLTKENKTTYTYDNAGNRLSKADGTDTVTYAYDPRNRLTQVTDNGIITTYSYDNNGNLIAESDGTQYFYDAFNRQVETNNPDGTWQKNIYDATGLRMATVENGIYTEYIFDRGSVIADYDNRENRTTRYIRGYDLVSQKDSEGNTSYYLHNAHGDVTKLVGINGSIKNSYSYDAFGNTTAYTEQVKNRFRYAEEQFDSVTGQYYLRARYYEPELGRFTQEDPYRGDGLNLYVYVSNNPIKYIDASGYCKDNGNINPYDVFETADEAAYAFALRYNDESIIEGKEYASLILKVNLPVVEIKWTGTIMPTPILDINIVSFYTYNEPNICDDAFSANLDGIGVGIPVAVIHTHGNYLEGYDNDIFSTTEGGDTWNAELFHLNYYMVLTYSWG